MDPNLRREIIMENYLNPCNKETITDSKYLKINSNNDSCIDNINIYLLVEDDIIKDIKFDGEACAITTSASSIMTKLLKNKTISEVKQLASHYENMINEKEYNQEILEEANCFDEIYKQANRKNCALLPWKSIKKFLSTYEKSGTN